MRHRTLLIPLVALAATVAFASFSVLISGTELIWFQTRITGLASYALLFASITTGEWRMITKGRTSFPLFRFHHPISMAAIAAVAAHFISAAADNYKWGKDLSLTQYLGFSFTDKWLTLMSLGALAFYMLTAAALASSSKMMRPGRFNVRRMAHNLGYIAFIMAYLHSVNLGTDLKSPQTAAIMRPTIVFSMMLAASLLATRIAASYNLFADNTEAAMAAVLLMVIMAAASGVASSTVQTMRDSSTLGLRVALADATEKTQLAEIGELMNQTSEVKRIIEEVRDGNSA